eukprot:6046040-Pyramimonas_sp.AAC.1
MGAAGACVRWHLGLRWSSLRGHETCEGCAKWMMHRARESAGIWAYGGAPYGATKGVRGVPRRV